jgi:hypothetical protein
LEHGRLFWHALPLAFIASSRHVFQDHDVCITAWLSEPQQLEVLHVPIDRAVMVAWQLEVSRIPLSSRLRRLMESSTFRASRESYALRAKLGIFRHNKSVAMVVAKGIIQQSIDSAVVYFTITLSNCER